MIQSLQYTQSRTCSLSHGITWLNFWSIWTLNIADEVHAIIMLGASFNKWCTRGHQVSVVTLSTVPNSTTDHVLQCFPARFACSPCKSFHQVPCGFPMMCWLVNRFLYITSWYRWWENIQSGVERHVREDTLQGSREVKGIGWICCEVVKSVLLEKLWN